MTFLCRVNLYFTIKKEAAMSLIKRSEWPWEGSLSDFFGNDRFFDNNRTFIPAVNVKENEKNYEVEVAAPGYAKNDFQIAIDNGLLTISATRKTENEETSKADKYTRREFGYTSFTRSFNLPSNTNEEDIDARYEDGVLKLSIARKDNSNGKSRKSIAIK
jgi:HSP20 family protein